MIDIRNEKVIITDCVYQMIRKEDPEKFYVNKIDSIDEMGWLSERHTKITLYRPQKKLNQLSKTSPQRKLQAQVVSVENFLKCSRKIWYYSASGLHNLSPKVKEG